MSIGDERETELQRRANRKKLTIPQLRQELTKHDIGYMSNWTKPVLLRRLEENELTEEWNEFLQEKDNNAVQEQQTEEVPVQEQTESSEETSETPKEEKE